ncbi:zinc finger BED domain-containing protein 4-like [Diachasma alloeum]|uniref:zinc finger BED domain-containing protein 4-like n=1 Tax=Diachasma alloeum TaxID=454923 RepID=UPI0007381FD2|nr:zinc finger BED domain-containing protein 4-like [Diachasma alloeum]
MGVLEKYKVDVSNIYSFTSDNGANMVKLGKLLLEDQTEEEIESEDDEDCIEDHEEDNSEDLLVDDQPLGLDESGFCTLDCGNSAILSNTRCAVHSLQLAVDDALKTEKVSKHIISKARATVKALRTPNMKKVLLRSKPNARKPVLDIVTRWHSTADMLSSLLELKDFCRKNTKVHKSLELNDKDWQYIEDYLKSLMPAKIATKSLQADQLTPGSFYGIWIECKLETSLVGTNLGNELVKAMEKRENVLMDNDALLASVFLDCRFMTLLSEEHRSRAITKLEQLWRKLEEQVKTSNSLQLTSPVSNNLESGRRAGESTAFSEGFKNDLLRKKLSESRAKQSSTAPSTSSIRRLLEEFARCPEDLDPAADILQYWESKRYAMPQLYQLATIAHAAPATQVSVERLFSGLRYIFSPLRANLKPHILDDIMVVRCNSQNTKRVQDIAKKASGKRWMKLNEEDMSSPGSSCSSTPSAENENITFAAGLRDTKGKCSESLTTTCTNGALNCVQ